MAEKEVVRLGIITASDETTKKVKSEKQSFTSAAESPSKPTFASEVPKVLPENRTPLVSPIQHHLRLPDLDTTTAAPLSTTPPSMTTCKLEPGMEDPTMEYIQIKQLPDEEMEFFVNTPSCNPFTSNIEDSAPTEAFDPSLTGIARDEHKTCTACRGVTDHLKRIERKVDLMLGFMANFKKLVAGPSVASNVSVAYPKENVGSFSNLKCSTVEDLLSLENQLKNDEYSRDFMRFLQHEYALTGQRDGASIFRTIIRRFVDPEVYKAYSWKGQKRLKNVEQPSSSTCCRGLKSFEAAFPNFIRFMHNVCTVADASFTKEKTCILFNKELRDKNKNSKRNFKRPAGSAARMSSSRPGLNRQIRANKFS